MSTESTSQNFYRELQKLIPELAKLRNVTRVIVDAKVGEYPVLSIQVESLLISPKGEREPITRVFKIVPVEEK